MVNTCKICSTPSPLYGLCDFSKNCGSLPVPLTGKPIYYSKCPECGLIFTKDLDKEDLGKLVYNEEYAKFDPDYLEVRPKHTASWLPEYLGTKDQYVLDYGGGNGETARRIEGLGYHVDFYDPYNKRTGLPSGLYDTVYSVEVFEHTTDPLGTLKDCLTFLKPDGKLIFTTLVNNYLPPNEMHWYISPRNGHVLMHSYESIQKMCDMVGLKVEHVNNSLHIAKRT